jgi:hypothetical protein
MRVLFAILVLIFVGCNSNKNYQYPSKFNQILEKKTFTLVEEKSLISVLKQQFLFA